MITVESKIDVAKRIRINSRREDDDEPKSILFIDVLEKINKRVCV